MRKIKDTKYRQPRRKTNKRKQTKGNYNYEKRRRQRERQRKRRKFIEKGNWKEKFKNALRLAPVVGSWIFKIVIVLLFAFVYVWYFGQKVSTVGDSMKPVLENGDVVLVNRIIYNASKPKRGDVIVFKPKGNENSHYYIKRIVGLPNETIEIIENSIFIDGEKLEEEYATTDIDDVGIVTEKITLGSDEYFVLGDDRTNSEDSRNADIGNVKRSYIYGKAWFVSSLKENIGFIK
ncbi:MAG: signal peptidase I [Lachnospiraceae bacterium]